MLRIAAFAGAIVLATLAIGPHLAAGPQPAVAPPPVLQANPWSPGPAASPAPAPANPFVGEETVPRDGSGRFRLPGSINGRAVSMLVDTGADVVAIPASMAPDLGIVVAPDQYRPIVRTASGTGLAARTRIEALSFAGHDLGAVDAVVVQDLGTVLLGQSALARLGRVEILPDRMVIHGN